MEPMAAKRRKAKDERKDASIRVRLTAEEKEAWTKAALKDGRDLSNWLRWLASQASGRS
jgi:uncharacterized protein (DUF1778 family)